MISTCSSIAQPDSQTQPATAGPSTQQLASTALCLEALDVLAANMTPLKVTSQDLEGDFLHLAKAKLLNLAMLHKVMLDMIRVMTQMIIIIMHSGVGIILGLLTPKWIFQNLKEVN